MVFLLSISLNVEVSTAHGQLEWSVRALGPIHSYRMRLHSRFYHLIFGITYVNSTIEINGTELLANSQC